MHLMKNCHKEIIAFHDQKVTLPNKERTEMRQRRNANRKRLKSGLRRDKEPSPIQCRSQGSYSMRTMVQQPDKDYDIDDGIYFDIEKLKGPRGGDKTASDAKEMVCKALHNERFSKPPESRTNCVRVYYQAGYHVDMPVYRRVTRTNPWTGETETWDELASTSWKRSNPTAVTKWFLDENRRQSPDKENGGQLRRIVRMLKAFARSRASWRERIASGFMITKLVVEEYQPCDGRDDVALYNTVAAIRGRLNWNLVINHPTVEGETVTSGPNDARPRFLRGRLCWAMNQLDDLFNSNCTRKQSLEAWDKVFGTEFFINRLKEESRSQQRAGAGLAPTPLIRRTPSRTPRSPVDKRGGGRYG